MDTFQREIEITVELARRAAFATEKVRLEGITTLEKGDGSPVTHADIVSQAIILAGLKKAFPADRVDAEETLSLTSDRSLKEATCGTLEELGIKGGRASLEQWVNYRGNPSAKRIWMIDPIDGTKGFRKGLSYAIAMGLYFDGKPRFGCMAVPGFPGASGKDPRPVIAYAGAGIGSYLLEMKDTRSHRLKVSDTRRLSEFRLVGSRAHDPQDLCGRFMRFVGLRELVTLDSQAKYLMLACGQADLYLRLANNKWGIGYPWDHCAGQIILEEAGGTATDLKGNPINYMQTPGNPIRDLDGFVASNGCCHEEVLEILKTMV